MPPGQTKTSHVTSNSQTIIRHDKIYLWVQAKIFFRTFCFKTILYGSWQWQADANYTIRISSDSRNSKLIQSFEPYKTIHNFSPKQNAQSLRFRQSFCTQKKASSQCSSHFCFWSQICTWSAFVGTTKRTVEQTCEHWSTQTLPNWWPDTHLVSRFPRLPSLFFNYFCEFINAQI